MKLVKLIAAVFLLSARSFAAPCCAGSSALPFLITTDDYAQISFAANHSSVRGTSFEDGSVLPKDETDSESTETFAIRGSYRLNDDLQFSTEIPLVRRQKMIASQSQSAMGLADISASVAYELLPETLHSEWKPRGLVFFRTTLPTGTSMYEVADPQRVGLFGKGFFETSLGAVFLKTLRSWDALFTFEGHWILPREFSVAATTTKYSSAFGTSALVGVGYSPGGGNLRLGANFGPLYDSGREITSEGINSNSSRKWVWTASASASYRFHDEWSATLLYSDQTLFMASNLDLNRSIGLSLLHNLPL